MEKQDLTWQQNEFEVEEEESGLQVRSSKQVTNGKIETNGHSNFALKISNGAEKSDLADEQECFDDQLSAFKNGVEAEEKTEQKQAPIQQILASNNGVEDEIEPKQEQVQEILASNNGVEIEAEQVSKPQLLASNNGVEESKEGSLKSGHSIYYDKHEESNFTSKPSVKEQTESNIGGEKVEESAALGIQLNGHLKSDHSIVHGSSVIDEIESAETDLQDDSDTDVKDYDVENVIQKQKSHDLYCPNCKSCITRRVILRKRKRKVPISGEDVKRNKLEVATKVDDKVGDGAGSSLEGVPPLAQDNYHLDTEPEIFRCLSCFSFFIPTGSGFKLFRCFGENGDKVNIKGEQTPTTKKNWFSSIFAFDKGKASVVQGSVIGANAVNNDGGILVPSDNRKDQSSKSLMIKEYAAPAHSSSKINQEVRGNNLVSENQDAKMKGKIAIGIVGKPENATKGQAGVSVFDMFGEETSNRPNGSAFSKEAQGSDGNDELLKTPGRISNGNFVQDNLPASQQTGLKFLISSTNADSQTVEKSGTEVSVVNNSDVNGKPKISTEIPQEHEQHINVSHLSESLVANNDNEFQLSSKDGGSPYEVSQHTITKTKLEIHSNQPLIVDEDALISSVKDALSIHDKPVNITGVSGEGAESGIAGKDTVITVEANVDTRTRERTDAAQVYRIEIVKSVVFGGLAESITSLSVVASAAGGDAATLNILALALANLIGGLFVIFHNLWELKKDRYEQASNQIMERQVVDRYRELLGWRENFLVHAVVAILSYIIFGLVPPAVYGFSFRKSDDKDLKLVAVAAAALVCILMLATGKAYVQMAPKPYIKTITTYIILGYTVSGFSYAAGTLVKRLLEKFGIFQSDSPVNLLLPEIPGTTGAAWASL